jgi:hypothetical protein
MPDEDQEEILKIRQQSDGVIVVEGELNQRNVEAFQSALDGLTLMSGGEIVFVMFGFDVDDGIAVVTAINAFRELLKRVSRLKLIGAPQLLCHNIYRVGMLETGDAVELIDMREDEPYG